MTIDFQSNIVLYKKSIYKHPPLTPIFFSKVAQLSWIEKKVAAALFGSPPTSTVHEALQNFLKVDTIFPAILLKGPPTKWLVFKRFAQQVVLGSNKFRTLIEAKYCCNNDFCSRVTD